MLETTAEGAAHVALIVDASCREAQAMLCLAARAGRGMWELIAGNGRAIEILLDTDAQVRISGTIDDSRVTGFRWLRSFWNATLTGDKPLRDRLLTMSVALEGPRRHTQAFELAFIEAIRTYARGGDPSSSIATALEATHKSELDGDWLHLIDRPRIAAAGRVFAGDAAGADAALRDAFEQHRFYWERPSKADHSDGWLSLSLAALMVIARDRGLAIETTSDYAPERLLAHA